MATNEKIAFELHRAFRPYVSKKKLEEYDKEFNSKKVYQTKFILGFFPKFINFERYSKKPKKLHDSLIFNYFIIEAPVLGIVSTPLFWQYLSDEKRYQKSLK